MSDKLKAVAPVIVVPGVTGTGQYPTHNYRHGGRTKEVADAVRYINALAKKARDPR